MVLPAISKPFRSVVKSPSATTSPSSAASNSSSNSSGRSSSSNNSNNKDTSSSTCSLDAIEFNIFAHIENLRRTRLLQQLQSQQQLQLDPHASTSHRQDFNMYNHKPTTTLRYSRSCNGRDRIPYPNHENPRARSRSSELRVSTVMAISTTSSCASTRMHERRCNNFDSDQGIKKASEVSSARSCRQRKMPFFVCGRPCASDE